MTTFIRPVEGTVTRDFYHPDSVYVGGQHMAIDIGAATGTPIRAIADGQVVADAWDTYSGHYVALKHAGGWRSTYRHLVTSSPLAVGQTVRQRETIGSVGTTGLSTGPHLHFDLWNSNKQSPEAILKNGWWAHDPDSYLGREDVAAPAAEEPAPATPPERSGETYTVKAGDSLSSIASDYPGVSWQDFYAINKDVIGDDPNAIPPGMVLTIPQAGATTYTVQPGDNLSIIADKYRGVSSQDLYEANKETIGSSPDLIQPGMVLVIP